mmetsp:Transcript_799/g.5002  ORF Transcript_799/g.5002 Transcript_799/m.5002 type:complete len:124 (+) Transcript_799:6522-6893(+)
MQSRRLFRTMSASTTKITCTEGLQASQTISVTDPITKDCAGGDRTISQTSRVINGSWFFHRNECNIVCFPNIDAAAMLTSFNSKVLRSCLLSHLQWLRLLELRTLQRPQEAGHPENQVYDHHK